MYENPYYRPYWLNSDELEHYGVKGMRWGVRKEEETSGKRSKAKSKTKTINKTQKTNREIVDYPYSNDTMHDAMEQWYDRAKGIFDNMQGWGESDKSKWGPAYMQAAKELEYTELELAMLLAWQALCDNGLQDRFSVCVSGDANATDASGVKVCFYDTQKGDTCANIGECLKRKRQDQLKSRKKNVDPNAKPVSVKVDKTMNASTAAKIHQLKSDTSSAVQNAVNSAFKKKTKK